MNQITIKKLLNVSSPILITGETGTGKSKMARKIFDLSSVHKDKFLTLHLASIKEELFESELFGHKKGAFTGAVENKAGYLAETGKGTLFLDEIGELSMEAQKKLLYLLEEKKYTPVGSTAAISFEGRLIMATNKNLESMVKEGKFREDLYYRLIIFNLKCDPIASNKEKLQKAIYQMLESFKIQYQKPFLSIAPELMHVLMTSPWKGNYRELKNCIEFVVAMSEERVLTIKSLPEWFQAHAELKEAEDVATFISEFPGNYDRAIECFEQWYLRSMLEKNAGRVNETARLIGISKTTLISKARKYDIDTLSMRAEAGRRKGLKLAA